VVAGAVSRQRVTAMSFQRLYPPPALVIITMVAAIRQQLHLGRRKCVGCRTPLPAFHHAGGGYSRWNDMAVTRWREDSTRDHWGTFCYLRDAASGKFWSTGYQPSLKRSDSYQAIFSEARAEFRCRKDNLDAYTEIAVSPEDDIELRRITITNRGRRRRTIDLTSYAEVVWPCLPRMQNIRDSATCSCKVRSCVTGRPSWLPAGRVRRTSRCPGCSI